MERNEVCYRRSCNYAMTVTVAVDAVIVRYKNESAQDILTRCFYRILDTCHLPSYVRVRLTM